MNKNSKIYIAGHLGMVGSAIRNDLGWKPSITLNKGVKMVVKNYLSR